jgi:hypothetical protein
LTTFEIGWQQGKDYIIFRIPIKRTENPVVEYSDKNQDLQHNACLLHTGVPELRKISSSLPFTGFDSHLFEKTDRQERDLLNFGDMLQDRCLSCGYNGHKIHCSLPENGKVPGQPF